MHCVLISDCVVHVLSLFRVLNQVLVLFNVSVSLLNVSLTSFVG